MTDKTKILWVIIASLSIALIAVCYRLSKQEHKPDYKSQYENLVKTSNAKIAAMDARNSFIQDSLSKRINDRSQEEKNLSTVIKNNNKHYENKIHAIDSLGLDGSVQLRAAERIEFRRTYGY